MNGVVRGAIAGFVVSVCGLSVLSVLIPPRPPAAQTAAPPAADLPSMQPQATAPKPAGPAPASSPVAKTSPKPAPAEAPPRAPGAGSAPGMAQVSAAPAQQEPQAATKGPQAPQATMPGQSPGQGSGRVAPLTPAPRDTAPATGQAGGQAGSVPGATLAVPKTAPAPLPSAAPTAPLPASTAPGARMGTTAPSAPAPQDTAPVAGSESGQTPVTAPDTAASAPSAATAPAAPSASGPVLPAPAGTAPGDSMTRSAPVAPAATDSAMAGAMVPAAPRAPAPIAAPITAPAPQVQTAGVAPGPIGGTGPVLASPALPQAAAPDHTLSPDKAAVPAPGADNTAPKVLSLSKPGSGGSTLPQVGGATTTRLPGLPSQPLARAGQAGHGSSGMPGTHVAGLPGHAAAPLVRGGQGGKAPLRLSHRMPAHNPGQKPELAIILIDTGRAGLDRAQLAASDLPVTYAVDPAQAKAGDWAKAYAKGGHEVLITAPEAPGKMTGAALGAALRSDFAIVPQAVGLIAAPAPSQRQARRQASALVTLLAAGGRGLVTYDHGLNAGAQQARIAGLPEAVVSAALTDGDPAALRVLLDRAAFHAAQMGSAVIAVPARPELLALIAGWTQSLRGKAVALVPVSAVMSK